MSGLPGAEPGASYPTWVVNAWNSRDLDIPDFQSGVAATFWTEFLRALHEVDPDMLVNIEHEDVSLGRIEGLEVAADMLKRADAALAASLAGGDATR